MDNNYKDNLISVIVTAYNEESYIEETLLGLKRQDYKNWETIIVDDGSTDSTLKIAEKIARKDSRFKVYTGTNQGRIAALNKGLSYAQGEFIAINDADDVPSLDRLTKEFEFLNNNPDVGLVGSYAQIIDHRGILTEETIKAPTGDRGIREVMLRYNPFVHSSIMYRRKALRGVGTYTAKFLPGFEWEIYANVMKEWRAANIPEFLINYRIRPGSLTASRSPLKRVLGVTRARWYVFNQLSYPVSYLPFVLWGLADFFTGRSVK